MSRIFLKLLISSLISIGVLVSFFKCTVPEQRNTNSFANQNNLTVASSEPKYLQQTNSLNSIPEAKKIPTTLTQNTFPTNIIASNLNPFGENYMGITEQLLKNAKYEQTTNATTLDNPANYSIKGIDVSMYQGNINWSAVAASNIKFAYIKATEGTGYTDPKWNTNIKNSYPSGIYVGAYHFARPDLNASGASEALWFANVIRPYLHIGYLRPVLDLEVNSGYSWPQLSSWTEDFMTTFKNNTGVTPIIYTSGNYSKNLDTYLNQYDLWIAHWDCFSYSVCPITGKWSAWEIWQYGGTNVGGIANSVDGNVYVGSIERLYSKLIIDPIQPNFCQGTNCPDQGMVKPIFPPEFGGCDPDKCPERII
ncbi:MAG: glycoside hydrolase family 25 protein [bacterium]